jgi:putative tryptophan/tyrosine transport system substrate-binding protein
MRRRDFLTGLLLTATTASTQAQQKAKIHRLAVVNPVDPVSFTFSETGMPPYRAFFERLRQLGFVEGQNLEVKRYSGEGHSERFDGMVREVVSVKPDVIFVPSTRLLLMFKEATVTIPVVSAMADPVRVGFVASMAQPGGNITGVAIDQGVDAFEKRFELLKQAVPRISKLGILVSRPWMEKLVSRAWMEKITSGGAKAGEAASGPSIETMSPFEGLYWREEDNRPAFERMVREGVDGIIVTEQNENVTYARAIIALAREFRLPAIYPFLLFVEWGGLMSFGFIPEDLFRDCARIVAEIFNGANPANIPISQPTKYEIGLNAKTAKELGIEIPPSLLVQADKVIE